MNIDFQVVAVIILKSLIDFGILLYSIIFHEVAHGVAALIFGDKTAQSANRITLNPKPHIDPIGTLLLPIISILSANLFQMRAPLFGWAVPVPVNPRNFKNERLGIIVVSLAGVFVNFLLAGLAFFLLSIYPIYPFLVMAQINVMLCVFNLIPLPPLDGYNLLMIVLPERYARFFRINETTLLVIFMFLIVTGGIGFIFAPIYNLFAGFFLALFHIGG